MHRSSNRGLIKRIIIFNERQMKLNFFQKIYAHIEWQCPTNKIKATNVNFIVLIVEISLDN